jgi:phosphatidylserine/phosphatidylglycerophosphate/cardiolipin synthase-like enzyme
VGSQNFSTESLEYNRELGILLSTGAVIEQLLAMFRGDVFGAAEWTA